MHKKAEEVLEVFKEQFYPEKGFDYVGDFSDGHHFDLLDAYENVDFKCRADFYGRTDEFVFVICVDNNCNSWPPEYPCYALELVGTRLTDAGEALFPIEDIIDQLSGYVVDDSRMESYLRDPKLRELLFQSIEFEFGSDRLYVALREIDDVIEGTAYCPLLWSGEDNRFVRDPAILTDE